MSSSSSNTGDAFDLNRIRQLVALMNEHELGEIDLRQGELRIRLRKHAEPVPMAADARTATSAPSVAQSTARTAAPPEPRNDEHLVVLKSPMVGTFYGSPSPDAAAFVKVGDHVGPETTVCIIEAMKVFNEIPAETKGQIVAVLVETGAPVEFGQPLFKVDPRL